MNKADLLKVLDMSEDEQWKWVCEYSLRWSKWDHNWYYDKQIICCIADLAFRLRDEAVEKDWCAWQIGSARVWGATHESEYNPGKFGNRAKPIHWIIAALIAKGEPNED